MVVIGNDLYWYTISPATVVPIADQEHNKNQEDEEEAAEEDREERHAGSDAEGAEAECKRQRAEKQQGRPGFNLNTGKTIQAPLFCLFVLLL